MMPASPPTGPKPSRCTCKVTHSPDGSGSSCMPDPDCVVHHGNLIIDLASVPVLGLQDMARAPRVERGQGYGQQPAQAAGAGPLARALDERARTLAAKEDELAAKERELNARAADEQSKRT